MMTGKRNYTEKNLSWDSLSLEIPSDIHWNNLHFKLCLGHNSTYSTLEFFPKRGCHMLAYGKKGRPFNLPTYFLMFAIAKCLTHINIQWCFRQTQLNFTMYIIHFCLTDTSLYIYVLPTYLLNTCLPDSPPDWAPPATSNYPSLHPPKHLHYPPTHTIPPTTLLHLPTYYLPTYLPTHPNTSTTHLPTHSPSQPHSSTYLLTTHQLPTYPPTCPLTG